MNLVLKRSLSRRTLLRGLGATVALPLLDSMIPAFGAKKSPTRMAFVYFPNGVQVDSWVPVTEGAVAPLPEALPRVLQPLAQYRDSISVLGGLTVDQVGEVYGVHRATATRWLAKIRAQVLADTRGELAQELSVPARELESIMQLVQSRLDVSVQRLLETHDP